MVTAGSRDSGWAAALGCRANPGWAALVVVAGGVGRPEVVSRGRAELDDPAGRVRKNVYAARALELAAAAAVEHKLERYFEAFEAGELSAALCQERVRGHRERLERSASTKPTSPAGSPRT